MNFKRIHKINKTKMSSFLISKFQENVSKDHLNSIITIKNENTKNEILSYFMNQKDKETVLFFIQNDIIPKSMSLNLFKFIVENEYWDLFLELDYNVLDIHTDNDYAFRMSTRCENIEVMIKLIENGANIHANDDYVLQKISACGNIDLVKFLIEKGANIHANDDGALISSTLNGHIEVVKFLVEKGADIHACDDFALKISSEYGHIKTVQFLLENGANIHVDDDYALRWSSKNGHIKIVKLLVENGADIHARGDSALLYSNTCGHIEIIKFLLDSDLEYFCVKQFAINIVKKYKLYEFYEKFKIDNNDKSSKIPQKKSDILNYINSQDLKSIKKCNEFDFSTDRYYCFFKALESNNYEMIKVIFDFIENKQDLQNYYDDVSFIFNDEIKNNYQKLFKNIELEKIRNKINELLDELLQLDFDCN